MNEEERAHGLRAEDRAIHFLTGYVDGVQRRFAHDITLFAACAVFDPSRRYPYDALSAAKCVSVLTQAKYFPDIITAEVFASANAYFTPEPSPGENLENTQGSTRESEKSSLEEITVTEYYASLNQIRVQSLCLCRDVYHFHHPCAGIFIWSWLDFPFIVFISAGYLREHLLKLE